MKQLALTLLMVMFGVAPAIAAEPVTFDFDGPDHDNPLNESQFTCQDVGDHCNSRGLIFEKDGTTIGVSARWNIVVDEGPDGKGGRMIELPDDITFILQDVGPDNLGLGVTSQQNGFYIFEPEFNGVESRWGEGFMFQSSNSPMRILGVEFNALDGTDCTLESCRTFELYGQNIIFGDPTWDLVMSGPTVDFQGVVPGADFERYKFVATGESPGWFVGGITVAVPEPATWLMMIFGFGMIAAQLKRRQQIDIASTMGGRT